jgi:hypothetical protein
MNRERLRRLERRTRARYNRERLLELLKQRAQQVRPNINADELDIRLRLAFADVNDPALLPGYNEAPTFVVPT